MKNRNLLMVFPSAFGDGWTGATPRFFRISKGLQEYGWSTTMLAASLPTDKRIHPAEVSFPGKVIRTPFPNGPHPRFMDRKGLRMLYRLGCQATGFGKLYEDPELGWTSRLRSSRFASQIFPKPDLVWGVTNGYVASLCASREIARQLGCPWIIEVQDPPFDTSTDSHDPQLESCFNDASAIITVTQSCAREICRRYEGVSGKEHVVYLSYTEETPVAEQRRAPEDPFVFLHAGVLYGGKHRNARNVVRAMKSCFDRHPELQGKLIFRIAGGQKGGEEVLDLAYTLGIPKSVELLEGVDHKTALCLMDQADMLLAIKYPDPRYNLQIPGKVFDYLGRRKPIIGIMGDCEAADILKQSGLGTVFDHEDVDGLADFLFQSYCQRQSVKMQYTPNEQYIEGFSSWAMVSQVNRILNLLLVK
ncbi:MAG: hypothetical protein NTX50_31310 [Candidatus Sumerlaeota bacterium]|nr:hypothetical protein [Candidatus Sumerlaeota bacterium]